MVESPLLSMENLVKQKKGVLPHQQGKLDAFVTFTTKTFPRHCGKDLLCLYIKGVYLVQLIGFVKIFLLINFSDI